MLLLIYIVIIVLIINVIKLFALPIALNKLFCLHKDRFFIITFLKVFCDIKDTPWF